MEQHKSMTIKGLKEEEPYYRTKEVIWRTDAITGQEKVITHWKDFNSKDIFTNRMDAIAHCLERYSVFTFDESEGLPEEIGRGDTPELNWQQGDQFSCEVYMRFFGAEGKDVYLFGENLLLAAVGQINETGYYLDKHVQTLVQ